MQDISHQDDNPNVVGGKTIAKYALHEQPQYFQVRKEFECFREVRPCDT